MVPARKHCARCTRWLLTCVNFYVAERNDDGTPKRLQSWCLSCQRAATRVRAGRKRRGARYNPQRKLTNEEIKRRRRVRHRRRQAARRKGDPFVPLRPFSLWLREQIAEHGHEAVARQAHMDGSVLRRLANGWESAVNKGYGIMRRLDVRLSFVDDMLTRFEVPLIMVYDSDEYPWIYSEKRPRKYPSRVRDVSPRRKSPN